MSFNSVKSSLGRCLIYWKHSAQSLMTKWIQIEKKGLRGTHTGCISVHQRKRTSKTNEWLGEYIDNKEIGLSSYGG